MFGKRRNRAPDEKLDRLGREVLRASAMKPEEADKAASSPFLFARIRASVSAEQRRRDTPYDRLTLMAARRAIPVMLLIAIASAALLWFSGRDANGISLETIAEASACSVTTKEVVASEGCFISDDDVLTTIVSRDERGTRRGTRR